MIDESKLAQKHRLMPATQTVAYFVAQGGGSFAAPVNAAGAEKRPLTVEERQLASISLGEQWRVWHLWTPNLAGIEPAPGDKLTDADGETWYVRDNTLELLDQRHRLQCVKEV